MIDIKKIMEDPEGYQKAADQKGVKISINDLVALAEQRSAGLQELDNLRKERNDLAASAKGQKPTQDQIDKGREIKVQIVVLEEKFKEIDDKYEEMMVRVPTIPSEDTPIGKDDSENVEVHTSGEIREFDFEPKTHIEIAKDLDLIDFERGAKVGGYRGYYLKNEGVMLAMGIMMHALQKMIEKGYSPMIPPTLVKEFALFGSAYFKGREYSEDDEIYKVSNREVESDGKSNKENKFLVGTAEPSLLAYYADEFIDVTEPMRICGFSQCYRSEIGSYGKDTAGLYRVHEFMKVEQVILCEADKKLAEKLQDEMTAISEELHRDFEIPYRKLAICTGDLSAGKYRQYDSESWMPGMKRWGETGSASIFLDWQSRRLNVKYKTKDGEKKPVYMLNNTAIPSPRALISILENHQQKDGSVIIPKVLRKFMPGNMEKIVKKSK